MVRSKAAAAGLAASARRGCSGRSASANDSGWWAALSAAAGVPVRRKRRERDA